MTGGRPSSFKGVTDGGPPGSAPFLQIMDPSQDMLFPYKNRTIPTKSGEQGGGRIPPSVTPLNDQAESLGTKEKISLLMIPYL